MVLQVIKAPTRSNCHGWMSRLNTKNQGETIQMNFIRILVRNFIIMRKQRLAPHTEYNKPLCLSSSNNRNCTNIQQLNVIILYVLYSQRSNIG